jgi:hypothetical protein
MNESEHLDLVLDPHAWFEHSYSLLLAADALWEGGLARMHAPAAQRRVLSLGVARGSMTLIGAALECAIKGLAAARGFITEANGKIAFTHVRGADSHALPEMAASLGVVLSDGEGNLLKRSGEYLLWAGRYPTAKRLERSVGAVKNGLLSLNIRDQVLAKQIVERIEKQAFGRTHAT